MTIPKLNDKGRMADIPLSPEAKITVERRGEIVLIGVNRPQSYNRFDPDAFFGLARARPRWCPLTSRSTSPKRRRSPSSVSNLAGSSTPRTSSRAARLRRRDVPPSTRASRRPRVKL
jgi:hypothetical protein